MKMESIKVAGKDIQCTMQDGIAYVSIRTICDAIGLDFASQLEKIKADARFSNHRLIPTVAQDGKKRNVMCLPSKQSTGWLYTINPNKVKPEAAKFLVAFGAELEQTIDDYYNKGSALNTQAFMDDPFTVMENQAKQIIAACQQIKEKQAIIEEQKFEIELQKDLGSLNWRDCYECTAGFYEKYNEEYDLKLYKTARIPSKFGSRCAEYCRANDIEIETKYFGSHHKEVNGYPEYVIKEQWKQFKAEYEYVDPITSNPDVFAWPSDVE